MHNDTTAKKIRFEKKLDCTHCHCACNRKITYARILSVTWLYNIYDQLIQEITFEILLPAGNHVV